MNISEHLHQAVDASDSDAFDLRHLARVARAQGTRARRRRRGAAALGSCALVGAVAVGSTALLGHGQEPAHGLQVASASTSASSPSAEPTLDPTTTGPMTGRGVVAALRYAVAGVAAGRAGAFGGQSDHPAYGPGDHEAYGQLTWTDADGLGVSVIGVNVQPEQDFVSSCVRPEYLHCVSTVTDGATLTTYEEHTPVSEGVGIRRVADLLRADGTRVAASVTNGYDLPGNQWDVTRPEPPLSYAQLTRIVERPWWGEQLPTYFLDQGRSLASYDELGRRWPSGTPHIVDSEVPGFYAYPAAPSSSSR